MASASEISVEAAERAINEANAMLLDIRQAAEYRLDGHIPDSINIPAFDWEHGFYLPRPGFAEEVDALEPDSLLIVACADGRLARGAAERLMTHGSWTDVAILEGGLRSWEVEDMPWEVDDDGEDGLVGAWV